MVFVNNIQIQIAFITPSGGKFCNCSTQIKSIYNFWKQLGHIHHFRYYLMNIYYQIMHYI